MRAPTGRGPAGERRPAAGRDRILVALDVADLDRAVRLASRLSRHVGGFKVGLELFAAAGPAAVARIRDHGPVFLDLKLHDIPTTVERAATVAGRLGVALLTVHAAGGPAMLRAAAAGLAAGAERVEGPAGRVLAVTVLTSLGPGDLRAVGQAAAADQVPRLAAVAVGAGVPGLVCAPRDLAAVRAAVGPEPLVVTPGVRPAGVAVDDHARAATPGEAVAAGADLLVVGRPITASDDPVAAAGAIAAELTREGDAST